MIERPFSDDPINRVEWLPASELKPNWYNPNHVFGPELDLLAFSILKNGWTQAALVKSDDLMIIDGFHRWGLSTTHEKVIARYGGLMPCLRMDVPVREAMMITVRINRAKGTHGALLMGQLVRALIDEHACDRAEVAVGIGAGLDEVDMLYQGDLFKSRRVDEHVFSKAWKPVETGKGNKGGVVR